MIVSDGVTDSLEESGNTDSDIWRYQHGGERILANDVLPSLDIKSRDRIT